MTGISHYSNIEFFSRFAIDTMLAHTKMVFHVTTSFISRLQIRIKLTEDFREGLVADVR